MSISHGHLLETIRLTTVAPPFGIFIVSFILDSREVEDFAARLPTNSGFWFWHRVYSMKGPFHPYF